MNDDTQQEPGGERLETVAQIEDAVDRLIERAQRRICVFDDTVSARFNSIRRHDALRRFLLAGRENRLRIVVHDAAPLVRDCPRLVFLLRDFGHLIAIHQTGPEARVARDPIYLGDWEHAVHRFHIEQPRGVATWGDPGPCEVLRSRFDEIWAASAPVPGATVLGL